MLKVAIVQLPNQTDINRTFEHMQDALERALAHDASLVVFPECALSGFSAHIHACTLTRLEPHLAQVQAWSLKSGVDVILPTALVDGERIYNCAFVFSQGQRQQLFKLGLTPSEQRFFSAPQSSHKVFTCQGVRYAVLLCMEAQQPPWTYFSEGQVELIVWPSYWGWTLEDTWGPMKPCGEPDPVFINQRSWQVPLLQANFSSNALDDTRSQGPEGLSAFIDADGTLYARGGHRQDGVWVLTLAMTDQGVRLTAATQAS